MCSDVSAVDEKAVSLNENYILKMCGSCSGKVGITLSDSTCEVYSYDQVSIKKFSKLADEIKEISDVKFSPQNDSIVYISSTDGSIKMWDLRTGNSCSTIFEESPETRQSIKPILSFDISCNDRVLCGGSELVESDAFMLFWDVRSKSLMGGYWNSHTDDVIQVNFSKEKPNKVVSGGVDGLINVFDISEQTEDDALQYSLSTECAVDKLSSLSDNVLSCITQNVDVQLWNIESADQLCIYTREEIAKASKIVNVEDCYIVDVFPTKENNPLLVTGSYDDEETSLKVLQVIDGKLILRSNLQGKKQITRCGWFDYKRELFVSGGEMGILSLWDKRESDSMDIKPHESSTSLIKGMTKMKFHKNKPY